MQSIKDKILAINGGSSSIKFSLYKIQDSFKELFSGEIENIGTNNINLNYHDKLLNKKESLKTNSTDQNSAANFLIDWLEKKEEFKSVSAIGHRIVHGMSHTEPEEITTELLNELKKISAYDPEHLPGEIKLIEIFKNRCPSLKQIACFDTSFHTSMPAVAKLLAIPRRYNEMGIQRYGFHGLSYAFLMEELKRIAGIEKANGKIILAHLGNGASIAAVKDGKSVDTSMGFAPSAGLPMSTRSGDLDPGVAWYLMQEEKTDAKQFNQLINHQSGLLGISETNSDMRELIKLQATDKRAAEAVEFFCYQTKKWVGSFTAVLGGVDTIVFSGGIGEHIAEIRERICNGLEFLGIELDAIKNKNNDTTISSDVSKVTVYVINTNEELMIAKYVCDMLNITLKNDL